jgi:uncharacterized protein YoxC
MSTLDTVFLGILVVLVGLFFIVSTVAVVFLIKMIKSIQRVVDRAEQVANSVENATEILKGASGKLAVFKLIKNIVELVQKKK